MLKLIAGHVVRAVNASIGRDVPFDKGLPIVSGPDGLWMVESCTVDGLSFEGLKLTKEQFDNQIRVRSSFLHDPGLSIDVELYSGMQFYILRYVWATGLKRPEAWDALHTACTGHWNAMIDPLWGLSYDSTNRVAIFNVRHTTELEATVRGLVGDQC